MTSLQTFTLQIRSVEISMKHTFISLRPVFVFVCRCPLLEVTCVSLPWPTGLDLNPMSSASFYASPVMILGSSRSLKHKAVISRACLLAVITIYLSLHWAGVVYSWEALTWNPLARAEVSGFILVHNSCFTVFLRGVSVISTSRGARGGQKTNESSTEGICEGRSVHPHPSAHFLQMIGWAETLTDKWSRREP